MILFFLPWLDRSPVKSIRYRGAAYKCGAAACSWWCSCCSATSASSRPRCGASSASTLGSILDTKDVATWVARLCTILYFAVLLPDALVHGARQGAAGARAGDGMRKTPSHRCCSLPLIGAGRRGRLPARPLAARPARPGQPAGRRAHLRQLLPRLPQRAVHALQPPDRASA